MKALILLVAVVFIMSVGAATPEKMKNGSCHLAAMNAYHLQSNATTTLEMQLQQGKAEAYLRLEELGENC